LSGLNLEVMVSAMKPQRVAEMDINQENYAKLLALVPMLPDLKSATAMTTSGETPLHIDLLYTYGKTAMISLCQYCEHPAGYTVADPSMMIAVYMDSETVEALVLQNYLGARRIYFDDISVSGVSVKHTMNRFLGKWPERVKLFETVFAVSLESIFQCVVLLRSPVLAC
jgi:uncharacterized protein YqiB (DUF1249 family)